MGITRAKGGEGGWYQWDKMKRRSGSNSLKLISEFQSKLASCAKGEHEIVEAQEKMVTYLGNQRLTPGQKYCRICKTIREA